MEQRTLLVYFSYRFHNTEKEQFTFQEETRTVCAVIPLSTSELEDLVLKEMDLTKDDCDIWIKAVSDVTEILSD